MEGRDFAILRQSLGTPDEEAYAPGSVFEKLRPADQRRIDNCFNRMLNDHHPYIRTIVLRTREYLETAIDPEMRTDGSSVPGGILMVPPDEECGAAGMSAVRQGFICPPQTGPDLDCIA